MESYSEIMQRDEETLRKLLDLYTQIEKNVPRWQMEMSIPPPAGLEGLIEPKRMTVAEFIRHRLDVLANGGEGKDYWIDLLGQVKKAHSFYSRVETSTTPDSLVLMKRVDSATGNYVLPTALLAKRREEIEKLIERKYGVVGPSI